MAQTHSEVQPYIWMFVTVVYLVVTLLFIPQSPAHGDEVKQKKNICIPEYLWCLLFFGVFLPLFW